MKRIGRGWLYEVFDLGNGRVRKLVYGSWLRGIIVFIQSGHFSIPFARKEIRRIFRDAHAAYALISKSEGAVLAMLGNPIFINDLEYEQDKVEVFGKVFAKVDLEEKKKMIDMYVAFILATWQYGIADKIFNFGINNGINREGAIVQIDFGELSLTKAEVEREIREQSWLTSYSYLTLRPLEMRKYYKEKMAAELTIDNLTRYWKGG